MTKGTIYLIFGLAAALIVAAALSGRNQAAPAASAVSVSADPKAASDSVEIPLSEITQDAKKYSLDVGGKAVRFFAVLGSEGRPRTAIDGCESCGTSKGYYQEGRDMVCGVCGKHFAIDDLGSGNLLGKGCQPMYLANSVLGDKLIVKKSDLEAYKNRF